MENKWVKFGARGGAEALPRVLYAGAYEAVDSSYRWTGEKRDPRPRAVFQFTLGGEGRLVWRGGTLKLRPGEAFCYDLSDPTFSYFYPPECKEPWAFVYCVFTGMTGMVTQLVERRGPVFHLGEASLAVQRLRGLLNSAPPWIDDSRHFELCAGIVAELVGHAENHGNGGKGEALASRAAELLQAALDEPFRLDDLARRLEVTPEHLCRAFRARLGTTPKAYHDELRLGRVCARLLNSADTIKEIAQDAGFIDLSHFNKFFKARRGATPGEFRRHAAFRH